jgi:hypothetical protein
MICLMLARRLSDISHSGHSKFQAAFHDTINLSLSAPALPCNHQKHISSSSKAKLNPTARTLSAASSCSISQYPHPDARPSPIPPRTRQITYTHYRGHHHQPFLLAHTSPDADGHLQTACFLFPPPYGNSALLRLLSLFTAAHLIRDMFHFLNPPGWAKR